MVWGGGWLQSVHFWGEFVQHHRIPRASCLLVRSGSWCSGITFALHAKGPGFKSQRVHLFLFSAVSVKRSP